MTIQRYCLECSTNIYPGQEGYDDELCVKHFNREMAAQKVLVCPTCKEKTPRTGQCLFCRAKEDFEAIPIAKHLEAAGVPPRTAKAVENNDDASDSPLSPASYYIFGGCGCGKTFLSGQLILNHLRRCTYDRKYYTKKKTVSFTTVPELLESIRRSFHKPIVEVSPGVYQTADEVIVKHMQNVDVLVLDDLGVEKPSEWVFTILYLIINHRYEHEKITIITSNYSLEDLEQRLGDRRLTSRIGGWCKIITMKHKDFRLDDV